MEQFQSLALEPEIDSVGDQLHFTDTEFQKAKEKVYAQLNMNGKQDMSVPEIKHYLDDAFDKQALLQSKRRRGGHKAAAGFQELATVLSEVLSSFSSVADTLQDCGVPFAKVGFQVVAFLLSYARIKSVIDMRLLEELEYLRDEFRMMDQYKEAYSGHPELVVPFKQMNIGIVIWAIQAKGYFGSEWSRITSVFTGSPTAATFSKLREIFVVISKWSTALLHANISALCIKEEEQKLQLIAITGNIGQQNSELLRVGKELGEQVSRLDAVVAELGGESVKLDRVNAQLDENTSHLESIKTEVLRQHTLRDQDDARRHEEVYTAFEAALIEPGMSPTFRVNLNELYTRIRKKLQHNPPARRGRQVMNALLLADLQGFSEFQGWRDSSGSEVLLLGTEEPTDKGTYSWISLAPIELIQDLQQRPTPAVGVKTAFFTCHPDFDEENRPDLAQIVASLAIQLASQAKSVLENKHVQDIHSRALCDWRAQWAKGEFDEVVSKIASLINVIGQRSQVYIIVDRLDTCQDFDDGGCSQLVKALINLAERSDKLKLLITVVLRRPSQTRACEDALNRANVSGKANLKSRRIDV